MIKTNLIYGLSAFFVVIISGLSNNVLIQKMLFIPFVILGLATFKLI